MACARQEQRQEASCGFSKLHNWETLGSTKFRCSCGAGEIKCISSETGLSFPRQFGHIPIKALIFHFFFNSHIISCLFKFLSADIFTATYATTSCQKSLCLSSQKGNCLGFHNWISPINMVRKERSLQGTLKPVAEPRQCPQPSTQRCKLLSPNSAPPENRDKFVISSGRAEISASQNSLTDS